MYSQGHAASEECLFVAARRHYNVLSVLLAGRADPEVKKGAYGDRKFTILAEDAPSK